MAVNNEFPKRAQRIDPYKNFRFKLKWDGKYVAGVSKASSLNHTTNTIPHRSGGDASTAQPKSGQDNYAPITLERGVTYDVAFEQWANKVWEYHNLAADDPQDETANKDNALKDFRKNLILEIYNEAGQKVLAYNIYGCWPSEFIALPEMDGNGNAVAIQSLKLENEGWERDTSVVGPTEPSFTLPAG